MNSQTRHQSRRVSTRALLVLATAAAITGCDLDGLIPADSSPGTQWYAKHAKGWTKWVMEQPWSTGPVTDPTGAACASDQSGKVWYLAGTSGGPTVRTCEIPANKALFFPLINYWLIAPPDLVDTPEEEAGALAFVASYFAENREYTCTVTLTVDGESFFDTYEEHDEALWTAVDDPFTVNLDDDNFTGGPGGVRDFTVVAGHWALLTPLSPGEHTIVLGGTQCDGDDVLFETQVTYNLIVAED
jgi:hypothetical protein